MAETDELVLFPVPRRFYGLVLQTVAAAERAEGGGPASPVQAPSLPVPGRSQEENYRGWTRDDVRRLKQETDIPTLRALFDLAEDKDGEPVGIQELEQATGKTTGQVRGDLMRIGTFGKKELGITGTWPFLPEYGAEGRAQYRVPVNVRRWWGEV